MIDPKGKSLAYRMGWRLNHEDVIIKGGTQPTTDEQSEYTNDIESHHLGHDTITEETPDEYRDAWAEYVSE